MLLHQFIMVFVSAFKRFESVLLTIPDRMRQSVSPSPIGGSEMEESETEQAA
jgi:hypothetical protein